MGNTYIEETQFIDEENNLRDTAGWKMLCDLGITPKIKNKYIVNILKHYNLLKKEDQDLLRLSLLRP